MVERYDANLSRFSGSRRAEPTITEQCGKVLGHLMGLPGPVEQSKLLEENKRTATEQEVVRGMVHGH